MRKIKVFVEGGPTGDDSAFGRAQLGLGFRDLFQKQRQLLADQYVLLDFTFCGGRGTARKRFQSEVKANLPNQICALLVDAEAPFVVREGMNDSESRKFHLSHRTGDEWDMKGIDSTVVHLMIQCMETWIIADPTALANFYGQGFPSDSLPKRSNLEDEPKESVAQQLELAINRTKKATSNPKKRGYKKVDHGSKLLAKIDPRKVAIRCPHFGIFVDWLESQVSAT